MVAGKRARFAILLVATCAFLHPGSTNAARAQEAPLPQWAVIPDDQQGSQRRAFVLGIPEYQRLKPVRTAFYDAQGMATTLDELSFKVTQPPGTLTRTAIIQQFQEFLGTVQRGDTVVFYFSGHGFERNGINYLAPPELGDIPANRVGLAAISLDWFMNELQLREPALSMFILDACRADIVPRQETQQKQGDVISALGAGLAPVTNPPGVFIAYAAAPRQPAFSRLEKDPQDSPSLFTRQLIRRLQMPAQPLHDIWPDVVEDVYRTTGKRQRPWSSDSGFYTGLVLNQRPAYPETMEKDWRSAVLASESGQQNALRAFVKRHPDSRYVAAARARIDQLERIE